MCISLSLSRNIFHWNALTKCLSIQLPFGLTQKKIEKNKINNHTDRPTMNCAKYVHTTIKQMCLYTLAVMALGQKKSLCTLSMLNASAHSHYTFLYSFVQFTFTLARPFCIWGVVCFAVY